VEATVTAAPNDTPGPSPTVCTLEFEDVPVDNTFYPFVRCLACQGIVSGYPCGDPGEPCNANQDPYFRPGNPVTRGQIAKIVSESAGYEDNVPPSRQTFADVLYGSTFWEWVERLSMHDVMQGYPCEQDPNEPCDSESRPYFRPGNGATRSQLVKMMTNAAQWYDDISPDVQTFADVPYGHPFWLYIERYVLHRPVGINGYPCGGPGEPCDPQNRPYFRPYAGVTRGQTSKIVADTFFPGCNPLAR
jgi:hypothetical protein